MNVMQQRRVAGFAALLLLMAVVPFVALPAMGNHVPPDATYTSSPGDGSNEGAFWDTYFQLDSGSCSKLNQSGSSAFVMPSPPEGEQWFALVVKQGSPSSNEGPDNFIYLNPEAGHSYPSTGSQAPGYSHLIVCSVDELESFGADLTVKKVVINDPDQEGTDFDFTESNSDSETDTDFTLGHNGTKPFSYELEDGEDSVTVDVTEDDPGVNWATSVQCWEDGGEGDSVYGPSSSLSVDDLELFDGDNVLCVFTNTYTPPIPTTQPPTTEPPTTQPPSTEPPTPTTAGVEVLGIQVTTTTVAVAAETLPFTGFEAQDAALMGLMVLAGGGLLLLAANRREEDEATVTESFHGWSR